MPTIGDALASLDDVCNDLAEVLRQISDIGAELAHKDRLSLSDVQEVRVLSFWEPLFHALNLFEPTRFCGITTPAFYRSLKWTRGGR